MAEFYTKVEKVYPTKHTQLVNLDSIVKQYIFDSGVKDGNVLIYPLHTTAGILVNEDEQGFKEDWYRLVKESVADERYCKHNELHLRDVPEDERENGVSHLRRLLTSESSMTFAIREGEILIGRWQSVFLAEYDGPNNGEGPKERQVVIQVYGNK